MIRWLALVSLVVGLAVGAVVPRSALSHLTGHTLSVALTPPTLSSGSSPTLNCGWHTICLPPPDYGGYGLDWEDGGTGYGNPWHFRGFFYVSNTSRAAFKMYPLFSSGGGDVCDVMTVWITEIHSGQLMAIPTFAHTNITNGAAFSWFGSPWTTYNSRQIGVTIDEMLLTCSNGSHVHEASVNYTAPISLHTSLYPVEGVCSGNCGQFQNNNINNWTRSWQWQEGVSSH